MAARKARSKVRRARRAGRVTVSTVGASAGPLPNRFICDMPYVEQLTLTSSSTADFAQVYNFSLNSTYDPNVTGAGHQPYGRDQLVTFYGRYRVIKCYYRIVVQPTALFGCSVGICHNNNGTDLTGYSSGRFLELPHTYMKALDYNAPTYIKGHVTLRKLIGQTETEFKGDDNNQSVYDTSPVSICYLTLALFNGAASAQTIRYTIRLKYRVEWFDPLPVAQS